MCFGIPTRQGVFVRSSFVGPHVPLGLRHVCRVFNSWVDPTPHQHVRLALAVRVQSLWQFLPTAFTLLLSPEPLLTSRMPDRSSEFIAGSRIAPACGLPDAGSLQSVPCRTCDLKQTRVSWLLGLRFTQPLIPIGCLPLLTGYSWCVQLRQSSAGKYQLGHPAIFH